jgi:AbrB family looped-hinge helix DNA binding protein
MPQVKTKLGEGGRLVIPAEYREAMGVKPGDDLVLVLEARSVRVLTPRDAVKQAQALVRRYVPEGTRLAAELIDDRRRESRRE